MLMAGGFFTMVGAYVGASASAKSEVDGLSFSVSLSEAL